MHSYIPKLKEQYLQGKISRREFMRLSALLGLSMASITGFLSGCSSEEKATATSEVEKEPTAVPPATGPKRGGELRVAHSVQRITDPAIASWFEFNIFRNVAEYLCVTNQDNITEPWLLERWEPSEDLKTWTLYLRKGIKFNHGPELTADDVIFNFKRWLDPETGSSMLGLMGSYLQPENIEKVDDYTVRLSLDSPQIAVPEHLYHNPAVILSKDFEGDWTVQPYGTGPFTLEEYVVDERVYFKRREDYWREGADGQPLPYLDSIRFVNLGEDTAPAMAALTSGEVHLTAVEAPLLDALEGTNIEIATQVSSFTHVIRMRADKEPFSDVRLRNAIKACQDRQQIMEATMRGYGALAEDHHVSPIYPAYCPGEIPPRDIEKAKALLAEAGFPDGLDVTLSVIQSEPEMTIAQLLKENCAPAGINIELNVMPPSMYWDQWTEVDFGITSWTHRPLSVMILGLAYRTGVPWNETHWSNKEFDELLTQAEGTLDVQDRRELMCKIQKIMQEEGPVAIPRWAAFLWGHAPEIKNFRGAPSDHLMLYDVWMDQEA
jgi:peptide/nickel transport system substrate-binding protein